MTLSSVTVVLPQPPEPVLESLTVMRPLGEVGVKVEAAGEAPFVTVPVPQPPDTMLQPHVPGEEADDPVNVTAAVPHWSLSGPALTEGAETHVKVIWLLGFCPVQAPFPVAVSVITTLPVAVEGVKVGVRVVPPAVIEPLDPTGTVHKRPE